MLPARSILSMAAGLLILAAFPLSAAEKAQPIPEKATTALTSLQPLKLARDPQCNLLIAECRLNGIPCRLIVDTAASHTTFDVKFIKKHFPHLPLQNIEIAPGSNVNTAPQLFLLESFSVGGLLIKDFYGFALDMSPLQKNTRIQVDGILGINYLGLCPFLLSIRNASLQFLERSSLPVQDMKSLTTERHPSGIFYIRCFRDDASFLLALDSGATRSFAPMEQWPADPHGDTLHITAVTINGHAGKRMPMKMGIPSTLRMGPDFRMDGLSFIVTEKGGNRLIGVDTLQYFDIIIDAPQGEIYALPPHAKPSPEKETPAPPAKREA